MLVPNAALRFVPPAKTSAAAPPAPVGPNRGRVWLMRDGKLVPRDLRLGASDGHRTQVLSGDVAPGDAVVTDLKTPPQGDGG